MGAGPRNAGRTRFLAPFRNKACRLMPGVQLTMSTKTPGLLAAPSTRQPTGRAQDGREAAQHDGRTYHLQNSTVTIEAGVTGPLARVTRRDGVEYAGPLPEATIEALSEVADGWY